MTISRSGIRVSFAFALMSSACSSGHQGDDSSSGALESDGTAMFVETTSTSFPTQPCGPGAPQGCSTNYTTVADINDDGRLDVVFANGGGHFVPGPAQPSVVYFGNGKGSFSDVGPSAFGGAIQGSHVQQVGIADVDGDGRLDVYLPGAYGLDADHHA